MAGFMLIHLTRYYSDTLSLHLKQGGVRALLGVLFVSDCFSNISPAMQPGPPARGSLPWHLSPAESRSRPHAEAGSSCLFSAWQLWQQKIRQLVASWYVYSRSCPCFIKAEL